MEKSWIPPDSNWLTPDDFPSFEKVYPADVISKIAKRHKIPDDKRAGLKRALGYAHRFYISAQMTAAHEPARIAGVEEAKHLHKSLNAAYQALRSPEMWDRLNAANAKVFPDSGESGIDLKKHW